MFKLLIVDDESIIVDGIVNTIDWGSVGAEVAGFASGGLEALELAKSVYPDIVITDIKMDDMDGLTLVGEISALFPFTKFIILTGYDEPEYIRKSLDLKVCSYLLKPAGETELLDIVRQQIKELEKERFLRDKILMIDNELERNKEYFIENLLDDLLNGRIDDENQLSNRLKLLNISFAERRYRCALFSIINGQTAPSAAGFADPEKQYLAVEEIIKCFWKGEFWPVRKKRGMLVIIFGGENIRSGIEWILDNADKFLNVSIAAATGEPCGNMLDIWKSYRQALLAYESNVIYGVSGVVGLNEIPEAPGFRFIYPVEKENALLASCIGGADQKNISESVGDLFDSMERQGCTGDRMQIEITGFLAALSRKAADMGVGIHEAFGCGLQELYAIAGGFDSPGDLKHWFTQQLERTKDIIKANQNKHIGNKIAKANEYLMANYINYDLSLDAISRHLQINPSYFSRIYKKETGQNFVEALTAIRMDKARSLLSSTSMKINEIAVSVGYQNSRYFWNIFKKANNCSPSEYRENRV